MKIYISHSREFDFKKDLYDTIKKSVLWKEHEFLLPHDSDEYINIKGHLDSIDLVIAEVSYPSTGQGIELAWMYDRKISIVCVSKEGMKVTGSLKAVTNKFEVYENSEEIVSAIKKYL